MDSNKFKYVNNNLNHSILQMFYPNQRYSQFPHSPSFAESNSGSDSGTDTIISSKFAKLPLIHRVGSIRKNIQTKTIAIQASPDHKTSIEGNRQPARSVKHNRGHTMAEKSEKQAKKKSISLTPMTKRSKTEEKINFSSEESKIERERRGVRKSRVYQFDQLRTNISYCKIIRDIFGSLKVEEMRDEEISRNNKEMEQQVRKYNQILSQMFHNNPKITQDDADTRIKVLESCVNNNEKLIERSHNQLHAWREKEKLAENFSEEKHTQEISSLIKLSHQTQSEIKVMKKDIKNDEKVILQMSLLHNNPSSIKKELAEKVKALRERESKLSDYEERVSHKYADLHSHFQKQNDPNSEKQSRNERKRSSLLILAQSNRKQLERRKMHMSKKEASKLHELSSLKTQIRNTVSQIKNLQQQIDGEAQIVEEKYHSMGENTEMQGKLLKKMKFYSLRNNIPNVCGEIEQKTKEPHQSNTIKIKGQNSEQKTFPMGETTKIKERSSPEKMQLNSSDNQFLAHSSGRQ